tara:strand:+ start:842 stop:2308 length:1467 start_codon:yes stop_codon:yes gene_type:complete
MSVVPDLLHLKQIPANLQQSVETDLLETSTFQEATENNRGFARFDLQKKGWLHSHSKLFLSIAVPGGGSVTTFPPNIGVASVISRAVLKIGNQVLNEMDDWNNFQAIKNAQINNETQIAREQYTSGACIANEFIYRTDDGAGQTLQNPVDGRTTGMSNGKDYTLGVVGGAMANAEGTRLMPAVFAQMNPIGPLGSPQYAIDLSDLFPFLKTHMLPLYMIDQQLSIELHWSPLKDRVILSAARGGGNDVYPIDRNQLKFCADYVFYEDSDLMARYAEANPRIEFSFPDYRVAKQTATSVQLAAGIVANLGMANRLCSRVLTIINCDQRRLRAAGNPHNGEESILSVYSMYGPDPVLGDSPATSYNIRYNDRFEFPSAITNKARLFSLFTQSEGLPFVSRAQYTGEGNGGMTVFDYQNIFGQLSDLQNRFFMLGTKLTNGRVGVRGIELHLTQAGLSAAVDAGGGYVVRSYIEYARLAVLENGLFSVFNA